MKKLLLFTIGVFIITSGFSQDNASNLKAKQKAKIASNNFTYDANTALVENNFIDAEIDYRKAISKSEENAIAKYNMGNAYYEENNLNEAFMRYKQAGEVAQTKTEKHKTYHNMGNVFMKNKDYEKAVEVYKEALRNNPNDEETRYNLALAKEMLKKEQENQKDDQNKDQNNQDQDKKEQDNKDNEGDKNDENKDEGDNKDGEDQSKDNDKDGKGDKEEDKDQQNEKEDPSNDKKEKKQPRPNQLSPQQIKNILDAMNNEEKKVQKKINAKKIKGVPVKSEKDW